MAPVVKELASLPDQDIRAMAVYLASFNENAIGQPAQDELAARLETSTGTRVVSASAMAHVSMKAPARSAMRSAARRCSAAGRRWR